MNKTMVGELLDNFDHYMNTGPNPSDSVLIHPGLEYGFLEVTQDFKERLRKDLAMKLAMAHQGLDRVDPTTKFVIMILENSY